MREQRKSQHIENYLKSSYEGENLLSNVFIEHNSLPNLCFDEIDTSLDFLGKKISFPLIIDAMTGGTEVAIEINRNLATLAKKYNIPMAVGSQTIAICEEPKCLESFTSVREIVGNDGIVIANLSASASLEEIHKAVEMIEADAIQLHLNVAQEIVMEEGDRDFRGIKDNIVNITSSLKIPVIIKEVGFGISRDVAQTLRHIGVKYLDISGCGGTNFVEIEDLRMGKYSYEDMYFWGNPTAYSIIKAKEVAPNMFVIGSGGIRTAVDMVKSIVIGADLVGMSGEILSFLLHGGIDGADFFLEELIHKFKAVCLLTGSKDINSLKSVKYKTTGVLKELLSEGN